jgi:hypothetical protein
VRKVDSGEVLAMKIMKKTAMMRKNQIGHIKAERDAMVCFGVLVYFFAPQTKRHLRTHCCAG